MPEQILPVNNLDQVGLILDTPPVAVPPQGFTDGRNVRFRDGAIRKMEGEVDIFNGIFDPLYNTNTGLATANNEALKYVAWWPNPNLADNNSGYYLVIIENTERNRDIAYLVLPGADSVTARVEKGEFTIAPSNSWQHTFFQGGFAIIINNGVDAPRYIIDLDGNENINNVPNFAILPGWESYNVSVVAVEDTFTANSERVFDLNRAIDFNVDTITVEDVTDTSRITTYIPSTGSTSSLVQGTTDSEFLRGAVGLTNSNEPTNANQFTLYATRFGYRDSTPSIPYTTTENLSLGIGGDTDSLVGRKIRITISSRAAVEVRAGVVRSYGDFLTAGNLVEIDSEQPIFLSDGSVNPNRIIRNLPGVVRTSDVALPGQIPTNWNPFAAGVSTAEEFVISDTGIVQDMVELQGNLYLYSNKSISVMRKTGNSQVPFVVQPVTNSYGAQTTNAVVEFDGSHVVVGSEDVYIFGGHPGSIKSVSDTRVRRFFFDDLNPLHEDNMFVLRYQQRDEIWICYPSSASIQGECDRALIWNYRQNNWTLRDLRNVVAGDIGPIPGGGIPGANVIINGGTSGNNGIDSLGGNEKQMLVLDSDTVIPPGIQPGLQHVTELDIDNLGNEFPGFFGRGPLFWDIMVGPNFNSGRPSAQVTQLGFTFTLLDSNSLFVPDFPFTVLLDSEETDPDAIVATLEADSDFNKYFDIDRTIDSDHFVISTRALPGVVVSGVPGVDTFTYPNYATGTILVQSTLKAQSTDRSALTEDTDCDVRFPSTGAFDLTVAGRRDYQAGIYIPPECMGRLYFIDILDGTNVDSENIALQIAATNPAGTNQDFYDTPSDDPIYDDGRGGQTDRPRQDPTDSDSQYMYRDSFPTNLQSTAIPYVATVTGNLTFKVLVPSDSDGLRPSYAGSNIIFRAYQNPPAPDSNNDLTIDPRSSLPIGPDGAITAPTVTFLTGHYVYNPTTDSYDSDSEITLTIPIYGNINFESAVRISEVAEYIRDQFNNYAGSDWQAERQGGTNSGMIEFRSRQNRRQYIKLAGVTSPLVENDFIITDSEWGLDPTDGTSAVYPSFTWTGPGSNGTITINPLSDTDNTLAPEIINQIAANMVAPSSTWTLAVRPPSIQGDDSDNWKILENLDRNPVTSAWAVSLTARGNLGLVQTPPTNIGGRVAFNPTIENSRTVREAGGIAVKGIPIVFTDTDGLNDQRGSNFTRSTPTYFAMRVRNTSVSTGQELILLAAGDANVDNLWNPNDTQPYTRDNGISVNNVNAVTQWVNTLRLANRRMNIFHQPGSDNFRIVPVNYDDLASFALELVMNDTQAGADRIQAMFNETQTDPPTLNLNQYSVSSINNDTGFSTLQTHTFAPNRDDVVAERMSFPSDFTNAGPEPSITFDVDRPWDTTQINPNKEYPIFATTVDLDNVVTGTATGLVTHNKVLSADIGWAFPATDIRQTVANTRQPYESYVERKQLALAPEFETEQVAALAVLADGSYTPSLDSTPQRNRLEVRMAGTNDPGEIVNLRRQDSDMYVRNAFNIAADYKVDMRTQGRFINARISDDVTEANPDSETYNPQSEWTVSGLQIEFAKSGRR